LVTARLDSTIDTGHSALYDSMNASMPVRAPPAADGALLPSAVPWMASRCWMRLYGAWVHERSSR